MVLGEVCSAIAVGPVRDRCSTIDYGAAMIDPLVGLSEIPGLLRPGADDRAEQAGMLHR